MKELSRLFVPPLCGGMEINMKKIFSAIICLTAILTILTSCAGNGGDTGSKTNTNKTQSAASQTTGSQKTGGSGYNEKGVLRPSTSVNVTVENKVEGVTCTVADCAFFKTQEILYFALLKPAFTNDTNLSYEVMPDLVSVKDNATGEEKAGSETIDFILGRDVAAVDPGFEYETFMINSFGHDAEDWVGSYISKDCRDATVTIKGKVITTGEVVTLAVIDIQI